MGQSFGGIDTEFKIGGFKELEKAFNQLPNAVSKRILRASIKRALKPIKADAKNRVPVRTGKLRDSIIITTKLSKSQEADSTLKTGFVRVMVGTEWPEGAHGHLIEFGAADRMSQPFMRPAWDMGFHRSIQDIGDDLWKSLQRLAKRLHKQALAGKLTKVGQRSLFG